MSVSKQDLRPIDNVLLHLRHTGLIQNSPAERKKIIFHGIPFSWLLGVLLSPTVFVSKFRSFLLSVIFAFVPYKIFNLIETFEFGMLIVSIWAVLNLRQICSSIAIFFFDFFDLLGAGDLTQNLIDSYSELPDSKKREFIDPKNSNFVQHLYATRQSWGRLNSQTWESYFTSVVSLYANHKDILDSEVDNYWANILKNKKFYETEVPPQLEPPFYWHYPKTWARMTPASLKALTSELNDINELKFYGTGSDLTVLGAAVSNDARIETVSALIELGADVNVPQTAFMKDYKFSILNCAVTKSSAEVVKFLLESGVDMTTASQNQRYNICQTTVLLSKDPLILEYILRVSEPTLLVDRSENSLFHYAAEAPEDRTKFMQVLLEAGHDINIKNAKGETALLSCLAHGIHFIEYFLEGAASKANIEFLLLNGADVNLADQKGNTPLHRLAESYYVCDDRIERVDLLIKYGADLTAKNEDGATPLNIAASYGSADLVEALISNGNAENYNSDVLDTALVEAVSRGISDIGFDDYIEVVEIFLKRAKSEKNPVEIDETLIQMIKQKLKMSQNSVSNIPPGYVLRGVLENSAS